jgi:gamma-glutamyltranspeptidase/glutathione hydrolase
MCKLLRIRFLFVLLLSLAFVRCASLQPGGGASAQGIRGVVVASHPIAADIGLDILESGGNAIDSAVATGLALGVVDQFNSGIGGGGFIVVRMADGTVFTIDGRETAPAGATRDMYVRDDEYDPNLSRVGPLAVGVPGILAAYGKALELAGTRTLKELISPSIEVAENGFELDDYYILRYGDALEKLKEDTASVQIYLRPDGSPLEQGDILKQPDLAGTYSRLATDGLDYFYRGDFAKRLAGYMDDNGGLITFEDMAGYSAKVREPVTGTYRGYEIIGMAPPSSGGVHIIQILNMLEASRILAGKTGWDTDSVCRTAQFMRKAFEDRAEHLGDIDYYPVPVELLTSKRYAESCVAEILGENASAARPSLTLPALGHTTNICVIDRWGNVAAINQTVNLTYGAKITLPGTGVILNNEMDDFSARPGVPNAFGLIGSEANSIASGKRPLSSMSPTIVLKDGKPALVLGGAGGPTIITAVLQVIIGIVDFGDELAAAQARPRFHHQFRPDLIIMEEGAPEELVAGIRSRGHEPMLRNELGRINAIAWSEKRQKYVGVADPRGRGAASAY